ncbi:MAG TPA: carbamoyltransferase C-terminal domain-containing protein [Aggregatilineales bacterium]|nr:carbamoyltransferase C-terminal domain-containing protein [Aggregatilineales bacterium]
MYILGINAYHGGASACLIKDGQLIAAVEEERFNRIKYWAGFPVQSIRYVLSEAGIEPQDLDHIGISRNPNAHLFQMALYAFKRRPSLNLVTDRLKNVLKVSDLKSVLSESLGVEANSLKATFHNVEHHRAHMASAFFVSPFDEAAVLSVDGAGDFVTTMWGSGKGNQFEVKSEINFPHSLGIFYTAISQWLGFVKYGDEGKVMGLAPYGKPLHMDLMRKIVRVQRDGTFDLDLDYFVHHAEGASMTWEDGEPTLGMLFSSKLSAALGDPRVPRSEISQQHMDVAASLQAMLEEAEFALVRKLQAESGQRALCMAGGVALNSVFNGKVLPATDFTDIYIQPSSGDAGTALGVCYYIYHQVLGNPRNFVMNDSYTGPQFSNDQIQVALAARGLDCVTLDEVMLVKRAAEIVADGNVLGWFQGRMEWGPRALGNRSIIADPRRDDMKDILNARIKHREKFRPFAPSVLLEATSAYFDQSYPDPFMIKVYNVLPEKRAEVPAITHVDGTGRLQTVDRQHAPLYWSLINAFGNLTGTPLILNTSFNENEPIVCTPQEAIDCFMRTRMDALAIGNYLVQK